MTTTDDRFSETSPLEIEFAIDRLSDYCDRGAVTLDDSFKDAVRMGKNALTLLARPTDPRLIYARSLLLSQAGRKDLGNHG